MAYLTGTMNHKQQADDRGSLADAQDAHVDSRMMTRIRSRSTLEACPRQISIDAVKQLFAGYAAAQLRTDS